MGWTGGFGLLGCCGPAHLRLGQRFLLLPQALGADAVRGGGVEALFEEGFDADPFAVVVDVTAPGADAQEAKKAKAAANINRMIILPASA